MQIFLPIADISVDLFLLLGLGGLVGFLSGMFGVGGGFLMTPMLIFIGIPPAVAVSTQATQITASSVSGAIAHWRRQGVDLRMGLLLTAGGVIGSESPTTISTAQATVATLSRRAPRAGSARLRGSGRRVARLERGQVGREAARSGARPEKEHRHRWRFLRSGSVALSAWALWAPRTT